MVLERSGFSYYLRRNNTIRSHIRKAADSCSAGDDSLLCIHNHKGRIYFYPRLYDQRLQIFLHHTAGVSLAGKEKIGIVKLKNKNSVQELIGFERFTKYGVRANKREYVFYHVEPTNISVLPP